MKIVCFKYAQSQFEQRYLFSICDSTQKLPISFCFYLIETSDKKILVDVGCNSCDGFVFSPFVPPLELLGEYGLSPLDITDVVLTHAHYDHVSLAREYKNAVFYMQETEYPSAKGYLPEGAQVITFKERYDLGNGVTIKKIGGHSSGSSIVLVNSFVLVGDECYTKTNLTKKIPIGNHYGDFEQCKSFVLEYSQDKYAPLLFHCPEILPDKVGFQVVFED